MRHVQGETTCTHLVRPVHTARRTRRDAQVPAPVDLVPRGVAPPPLPERHLPLVAQELLLSREEVQRELVDEQDVEHAALVREEEFFRQRREVPARGEGTDEANDESAARPAARRARDRSATPRGRPYHVSIRYFPSSSARTFLTLVTSSCSFSAAASIPSCSSRTGAATVTTASATTRAPAPPPAAAAGTAPRPCNNNR